MESVLAQSTSDWHHVIVNDGGDKESVDGLASEFEKAYAGRLTVLHQRKQGMQKAANNAIKKSDSTYLVIHDDDDSWHPDYLSKTTRFLDKKGVSSPYQGVISKTLRVLEAEQEDGSFKELERKPYMPLKEISLFRLGYDNPFSPIAFLYRRSAHEVIGYFDPRWDMVADMDYNLRFLQQYEIGVVDEPLAYYHWRDDTSSKANANTVTLQKDRHGRFMNELKNHYLRQATTAREAAIGLALQVSAFAVENQWMTVEIRERMMETQLYLKSLTDKIQSLQEFNTDSLWPKITDDVLERLGDIQTVLKEFETVKAQLEAIHAYNSESTWPKLSDLSGSLESLHSRIEEFQIANAKAVGDRLDDLQSFNNDALWPKLGELQENILPKLEELQVHLSSLLISAIQPRLEELQQFNGKLWPKLEELQSFNTSLWPKLEELQSFNTSLWPKLEAQEASFQDLHKEISVTWDKQVEGNAGLEQLREEVRALKEENKKQWQLGRLRLQWLPRVRKSDSNDDKE